MSGQESASTHVAAPRARAAGGVMSGRGARRPKFHPPAQRRLDDARSGRERTCSRGDVVASEAVGDALSPASVLVSEESARAPRPAASRAATGY